MFSYEDAILRDADISFLYDDVNTAKRKAFDREKVNGQFQSLLDKYNVNYITLTGSTEERLKAFQEENNIYTKGPLSLVVQFTRLVQNKDFPLNPDDFQTSSKGQVAGLGGGNLKKILNGSLMISDFSKITFVSTI
jgi:hypothetical protein